MSQDDPFAPFGDDDKTVIRRPTPGGRARTGDEAAHLPPTPVELPSFTQGQMQDHLETVRSANFGDNPVTAAAATLLPLCVRLRNTVAHRDVMGLQQQLVGELRVFENKLLEQGMTQEQSRMASYALCGLLDETILNTPWGSQSVWGHQSLLVIFHKEAWAGEKFFQIVEYLRRQPAQNLNLIELCYLCLSLGFQGKYRIMRDGLNELENYRTDLFQLISRVRGDFARDLSPRWQGLKDVRNALMRFVPLWVVATATGALLFLLYLGYLFSISAVSDQTRGQLAGLGREKIATAQPLPPPVAKPPPPGRAERFTVLLSAEIAKNMVEVVDDRTLRIRNSFSSGSDQIKQEFMPMLKKIAAEFVAGQDTVLVDGHTDDTPIRSARFPSNWDLSIARAKHVADFLLASGLSNGHVRSKGSADGEPLVPNDSPEHRALNRRVDISIQ